jgi:hypothetical protein
MKRSWKIFWGLLSLIALLAVAARHIYATRYSGLYSIHEGHAIGIVGQFIRENTSPSEHSINDGSLTAALAALNKVSIETLDIIAGPGARDARGELILAYHFPRDFGLRGGNPDEKLQRLSSRYQVAIWSLGINKKNEYGSGDDLFWGLTWDGNWEPDPDWWSSFIRGRTSTRK